jgi:hypothetical protein
MKIMTVSYKMTAADHWGLNWYVMTHDVRQGGIMAVAALVIPVVLFQSRVASGTPWREAFGLALFVLLVSLGAGYPMLRLIALLKFRKLLAPMLAMQMTLAQDGLHLVTPKAEQTLKWSAIRKVRRDGRAIYLFLSPRVALVAPLRAFGSKADRLAFEEFATAHAGHA